MAIKFEQLPNPIEAGQIIRAGHVSQSLVAFSGLDAYDINLSGSFAMTGSIYHIEIDDAAGVASSVLVRDNTTGEYYTTGSYGGGGGGAAGSSGSSGTSGADGSSGSSGTSGVSTDGSSGSSGTSGIGTDGSSGSSGTSGADGSSGSSGTSGADGSSGSSGTSGSSGSSGTSGSSGSSGTSGAVDYISNVTAPAGTDNLSFTGVGSAFNSTVDITAISGQFKAVRASINSPDDIQYVVDSNSGEVIIGDSTPLGKSTIDEVNGRTILINQDNSVSQTLRFGFASWTGQASSNITNKQTFECTGYNIGQDDFNIGVYLPQGTWDLYQIGNASGGGSQVSQFEVNISIGASGAPRYFPRDIEPGAMFKVYYNYFEKKAHIWCSNWSGIAGNGSITFSGTNPN